jgi:ribosomal peptide maturation radical SAM protein 1
LNETAQHAGQNAQEGRPVADDRVLLICMPFGAIERPSLALGLLDAHCRRLGIECQTRYLSFDFARHIGVADYLWMCGEEVPYTAFAGEWMFSSALYGTEKANDQAYVDGVLRGTWRLNDGVIARLNHIRDSVASFLDACLADIRWSDYTFIGFTSVFQQNIASLALARRVRLAYPDVTIAFGGANWEAAMGLALQAQFPFVDLVFSGEADESFPAVLEARRRGEGVRGIDGVTTMHKAVDRPQIKAPRIDHMDALPTPDYTTYFEQLRASPALAVSSTLLIETARGCWWGEKAHCTFCGLNGATMAFRSKSPERVLDEFRGLRDKYGVRSFSVVDDILDMRYFGSVLPKLAEAHMGLDLFWEIKANLGRDQVRQLRDAGVRTVQPGIESLSDNVLKLMRKGTTGLRNIELLKWCREYGVAPYWNLLYGFPGETAADYEQTTAMIRAIWHLDPPTGWGPIRLDRFSPYHADPASFGMINVRPMAPFTHLYPFEKEVVMDIAYYFEFDYADGRSDAQFAKEAIELTRAWKDDKQRGALELRSERDGTLEIFDTRRPFTNAPRRAVLRGWKAAVYMECDRARTIGNLLELAEVRDSGVGENEVRTFLDRCVEHQLMVCCEPRFLSIAVHTPPRTEHSVMSRQAALQPA